MNYAGPERRKENLDDLTRIQASLTDIQLSLVEVKTKLENLHSRVNQTNERFEETLEKHNETLYGNGKPGLTSKIFDIDKLFKSFDAHVMMDKWMFGTVITLLVVIIGKLIVGG